MGLHGDSGPKSPRSAWARIFQESPLTPMCSSAQIERNNSDVRMPQLGQRLLHTASFVFFLASNACLAQVTSPSFDFMKATSSLIVSGVVAETHDTGKTENNFGTAIWHATVQIDGVLKSPDDNLHPQNLCVSYTPGMSESPGLYVQK